MTGHIDLRASGVVSDIPLKNVRDRYKTIERRRRDTPSEGEKGERVKGPIAQDKLQ